jgi:hypothetical protein
MTRSRNAHITFMTAASREIRGLIQQDVAQAIRQRCGEQKTARARRGVNLASVIAVNVQKGAGRSPTSLREDLFHLTLFVIGSDSISPFLKAVQYLKQERET